MHICTYLKCTTKSYISPSLNDSAYLVHACSECRNYQFHFNLLTLFHKYYPHLGICSFGQINSTDTQRRSKLWITTSTLKCNSEPQKHQDLLDQSHHYPCTSMFPLQTVLSEELQVFESSAEIHKMTKLSEVRLCWDLSTFPSLRQKSTNSTYL